MGCKPEFVEAAWRIHVFKAMSDGYGWACTCGKTVSGNPGSVTGSSESPWAFANAIAIAGYDAYGTGVVRIWKKRKRPARAMTE